MSNFGHVAAAAAIGLIFTATAAAQQLPPAVPVVEDTVFDGDFISIGAGVVVSPSYLGSDDYVLSPIPIVQGSYRGIDVSPRGAGLAVDFLADPEEGIGLDLGVVARLRSDRASQIGDEVVERLSELDRAVEVGPTAGISIPQLLNPFDSLTLSADVVWDIAGAHGGMVVSPAVSYFTPLSRSLAASLSLSAEYADEDFHDYYFRVTPADSMATGGALAPFEPDGSGFTSAGATLLLALDLNGDITDGGWGLITIAGYSRALGDAADTPFTAARGSADQLFGAFGIGYTF